MRSNAARTDPLPRRFLGITAGCPGPRGQPAIIARHASPLRLHSNTPHVLMSMG